MTTDTNRPAAAPAPGMNPERQAQRRVLTDAVRATFQHELNISYGNHPKQNLDIYHPKQTGPAPVFIFIHGGGFRNGDPGSQGYVGGPLLEHSAMYVAMGYRLVPDARYPESCDDVEQGLRWLQEHIAERGGDPSRIYLSGTSAGATLAAAVALRPWVAEPGLPADLVKGLVLFSGPYDRSQASSDTDNHNSKRFFPRLFEAIGRLPAHTIVVATDNDMPFAQPDASAMVAAIRSRGGSVEQFTQVGADHFSSSRSLAEGNGAVFEAVTRMMRLG